MKRGAEEANLVELEVLPGQSEQKNAKIGPVEKSLEELLDEVFNGQYDDFRAYLQQNNITNLYLSRKVKDRPFIDRPLSHLAIALQGTKVTAVELFGNHIGDQGAKDFGQALKGTNVTTVYLRYNSIFAQGAKDFGQALQGTKVTTVDLGYNEIGAQGAKDFALALKGTKVTDVYLVGNKIGDKGAKDFGQALQGTNVTTVELYANHISDKGAKDFGLALQGTNVTTVNLGGNHIGDTGAKDFAACIPDTLLIEANLGVYSFALSDALEKNRDTLLLSPYYMAALRLLPNEEKNKYINLTDDALNTEEGRLRYAGGILMCNALPANVANKILGYLPLMRSREGRLQTNNFLTIAKNHHPNGLAVEENNANEKSTFCIIA